MTDGSRKVAALVLVLLAAGAARAGAAADPWSAFRFLVGEWVGEGDGSPGKGSGGFSLSPELGGKVLVRKNRAEYPAANGRPAVVHEDLMVIHPGKEGRSALADYWDNEGHVIRYTITPSADGKALTFLSESAAGEPRFRLTYTQTDKDAVAIKFEIAPPGKPEALRTYIEAKARRKGACPAKPDGK
jgi:hypothetical protein